MIPPQVLKPVNGAMHNLHCCHAALALQNMYGEAYLPVVTKRRKTELTTKRALP
jgi:hypothetical protein